MRILTRYVLVELAKVFLVALGALTLMMILVGVVREATMQNVPLSQILRLIPYILPDALRIAIPVTLLLAVTSMYGRMSGSNEVVAAKALGISPMNLLWPSLVAAFLLSLITVWLNDIAVSWGRNGARRVVVEAVEEIAYSRLRAQKSYSSPDFAINVKRVDGQKLISPTITIQARENSPAVTVMAEEAELQTDRAAGVLKVTLWNGTADIEGITVEFPDQYEQVIPLRRASRAKNLSELPSWMALREIYQEVGQQEEIIKTLEQEQAAWASVQMLSGDFDALASEQWDHRHRELGFARSRLYRLQTEPHRRWSAGFSCLCFVWVGAPMAIRRGRSDFLTSFFLCFLPILVVYYPLLMYGIDGSKSGTIPPQAVWFGNLLLAGWGAWLLRKVVRY
ncbi:MAG: LptF/LptG family permease [Pirellulales bacterium]|nr:LptF/LptG family permease [Pirellulales bacterium]